MLAFPDAMMNSGYQDQPQTVAAAAPAQASQARPSAIRNNPLGMLGIEISSPCYKIVFQSLT